MKKFRNLADVLASPWGQMTSPKPRETTDRIYHSTRLEDSIYSDLRQDAEELEQIEATATEKLHTFPALSRDVYQSFYALNPKRNDAESLSTTAQKCNAQLMEQVVQDGDYPTLKNICEGRELPAFEAATEFVGRVAGGLDGLLSDMENDATQTLQKLENSQYEAEKALFEALQDIQDSNAPTADEAKKIVQAANKAASKGEQVEAVGKMIDTSQFKNRQEITAQISSAVAAASAKAEEVQSIIGAWSDAPSNLERSPANLDLIRQIRNNPALLDISKYLGRFRELFANTKKNGYAYGRGETYAITMGKDISKALTAELAMLASPETTPLFLRKYQQGALKQYQRRQPITKGMGDIICCLDESGSTWGDAAAWGKAVAMVLLEMALDSNRKFALIHFSGQGCFQTDVFLPNQWTMADKLRAAETFLDGGTDYETPLQEAMGLILDKGFENADIVFITDGACALSQDFQAHLQEVQTAHKFIVTGILLDNGQSDMAFSLEPFCQKIYRTSTLTHDQILTDLLNQRVS